MKAQPQPPWLMLPLCCVHAGPAWGWRSPFVVVAIPTLILAVVVWFTVPEPERGITEAALQVCSPACSQILLARALHAMLRTS